MRTTLLCGVLLALTVAGGLQIAALRQTNATLRTQVNELHVSRAQSATHPSQPAPVSAANGDPVAQNAATDEAHARVKRLRAEVAELEKNAAAHAARHPEKTDAPSTNRDPEKGMTRLEYLQNMGQQTPAQALQTLFWAALKGEDQALARTVVWDPAVRPEVQGLIDHLPAEARARYPTPELLWGLIITKYALDVSAIHIAAAVPESAVRTSLTVKGLTASDERLPMQLGPGGWQLFLGKSQLTALRRELTERK